MDTLNWDELRRQGSPWAYLVGCHGAALDAFARAGLTQSEPGAVIRTIRGSRCSSKADMFEEFARALHFPAYFGKNWQALTECLNDLDWLPGSAYTVVIDDADSLLRRDDASLRTLLETLYESAVRWATPDEANPFQDSRPLPFRVMLQCAPDRVHAVRARVAAAGAAIAVRELPAVAAT